MEIFEIVWEFLTFERVCLAAIVYFQIELYSAIDSTGKALREIMQGMEYATKQNFESLQNDLSALEQRIR